MTHSKRFTLVLAIAALAFTPAAPRRRRRRRSSRAFGVRECCCRQPDRDPCAGPSRRAAGRARRRRPRWPQHHFHRLSGDGAGRAAARRRSKAGAAGRRNAASRSSLVSASALILASAAALSRVHERSIIAAEAIGLLTKSGRQASTWRPSSRKRAELLAAGQAFAEVHRHQRAVERIAVFFVTGSSRCGAPASASSRWPSASASEPRRHSERGAAEIVDLPGGHRFGERAAGRPDFALQLEAHREARSTPSRRGASRPASRWARALFEVLDRFLEAALRLADDAAADGHSGQPLVGARQAELDRRLFDENLGVAELRQLGQQEGAALPAHAEGAAVAGGTGPARKRPSARRRRRPGGPGSSAPRPRSPAESRGRRACRGWFRRASPRPARASPSRACCSAPSRSQKRSASSSRWRSLGQRRRAARRGGRARPSARSVLEMGGQELRPRQPLVFAEEAQHENRTRLGLLAGHLVEEETQRHAEALQDLLRLFERERFGGENDPPHPLQRTAEILAEAGQRGIALDDLLERLAARRRRSLRAGPARAARWRARPAASAASRAASEAAGRAFAKQLRWRGMGYCWPSYSLALTLNLLDADQSLTHKCGRGPGIVRTLYNSQDWGRRRPWL